MIPGYMAFHAGFAYFFLPKDVRLFSLDFKTESNWWPFSITGDALVSPLLFSPLFQISEGEEQRLGSSAGKRGQHVAYRLVGRKVLGQYCFQSSLNCILA